jgi:hypothetical protein
MQIPVRLERGKAIDVVIMPGQGFDRIEARRTPYRITTNLDSEIRTDINKAVARTMTAEPKYFIPAPPRPFPNAASCLKLDGAEYIR